MWWPRQQENLPLQQVNQSVDSCVIYNDSPFGFLVDDLEVPCPLHFLAMGLWSSRSSLSKASSLTLRPLFFNLPSLFDRLRHQEEYKLVQSVSNFHPSSASLRNGYVFSMVECTKLHAIMLALPQVSGARSR